MNRFWDIESYRNLFCIGFLDENDHLDMFYICEEPEEVERACKDSGYSYKTHDLTEDASLLKKYMANPIPSDGEPSLLSNFLDVEEKVVEAKEDWYFAYNSINYDIPMVHKLLESMVGNRTRMSSEALRSFSDDLINDVQHYTPINSYKQYGNHADVAMLNEGQVQMGRPMIGLKTLVGILGGSIVESESNKTGFSKSIYDDILYNINDVKVLKDDVYPGIMESTFTIRRTLLKNYPELERNNVTVNDSSATFVENIIAPDEPIEDTPVVTFAYPAEHIAEEKGVEQIDFLEDTKEWYMENVYKQVYKHNPEAADRHLAKFHSVYQYYDSYRGKNWNSSARHIFAHGINPERRVDRHKPLRTYGTILPFIDKYGNESPSYVQFSIGGIHGAEIFKEQLDQDRAKIAEVREKYTHLSEVPKKDMSRGLRNLVKLQSREKYKGYPQRYSHEIPKFYYKTDEIDRIIPPEEFSPYQIKKALPQEGIPDYYERLHKRYNYTSIGQAVHQDFTGFYPLLLINLGAFYDGKGRDKYQEVYDLRVGLKRKLQTLEFGSEEYIELDIEQDGYKLVLNSATGILDASFDKKIRANNKAVAMRIIGQLMTWRIGMALALEGANIPSSNTDGIYATNMDLELNEKIVKRELEDLYIDIEPENMFLVSKDSNTRMEIVDGNVTSAKGGSLTAWNGAQVSKNLAHPALVDRMLTDYLQRADIDGPVDIELIRECLKEYIEKTDKRRFVYMASWVMRSTSGSLFVDSKDRVHKGTIRTWLSDSGVTLSRYNTRKMKRGDTLDEYAERLFPDSLLGDPDIVSYLAQIGALEGSFEKGVTVDYYNKSDDMKVDVLSETKISNLNPGTYLYINNHAISEMDEEEINNIYKHIEVEEYVSLIAIFAKQWHNELLAS